MDLLVIKIRTILKDSLTELTYFHAFEKIEKNRQY